MNVLYPTPEEMTTALLAAAEAGRWNHWKHEVEQHTDDWRDAGDTRQRLTAEQFSRLPAAVACYPFVELCIYGYGYRGQVVWGFFCKRLIFEGERLSWVLVVYNLLADEIIHCMRPDRGKRYCERWGEQTGLFAPVRWKR